jgi:hypothetical protein
MKRTTILASGALVLVAGWMPTGVVTTAVVGTALVAGAGCAGKSDTR